MAKAQMRIERKRTIFFHTTRVGFLTGMYVQGAPTKWYNDYITSLLCVEHGDIELRKKVTWQHRYSSWTMEIKEIKPLRGILDKALCSLEPKLRTKGTIIFHIGDPIQT